MFTVQILHRLLGNYTAKTMWKTFDTWYYYYHL